MSTKASTSTKRPTYEEMIHEALIVWKNRKGSGRQAIKKYIMDTYLIEDNAVFNINFRKALNKGVEKGNFEFYNGPMGTIKLVKGEKPRTLSKGIEPSKSTKMKTTKNKATGAKSKKGKRVSKSGSVQKPQPGENLKRHLLLKILKNLQ
ncbi:Histone H1/5 [Gigaspora margarita]|uniref:Histone H1 n=1 Tax=Gigaspora margarita TaxID=4874 RepID=A0A8H4A7R8_GIGMA|nr:Histone H1/5 [Gigaspora margarita]